MGPTASGKTALATALLQHFSVDLLSVDSALVYRGMDIGTAKPSPAELAVCPHQMIDICDPAESFSAGDFCQYAMRHISTSFQCQRVPLLVGGTMLYFKSLLDGMNQLPGSNPVLRAEIESEAKAVGWAALHDRLQAFDPESHARIHPNDPQRISRAIEVYRSTGQSLTALQQTEQTRFPFRSINIILEPRDRAVLHQRIEQRLDQMFAAGFVDEVRRLYQRSDLHEDLPAIRCVGYRQVWQYLAGKIDYKTCREQALYATRQLAKRQLTWLRRWPPEGERFWIEDIAEDPKPVIQYLQRSL